MGRERPLRAGVVGPGSIGELHIETLRSLRIPVTALVASSPESARAHAQRLGVKHAYDSAAAMARSGEVDVVHVCTPNALHAAAATAAIDAGCDLVCEKPLTFDLAQADDLLARAERAGVTGGVCYHYRRFAGIAAARELVRSGALGSVRMLSGSYLSRELSEVPAGHWLADAAIVGPSLSLADVGVHWLDLAEHVCGLPIRAVAAQPAGVRRGEPFAHGVATLLRLGEDAAGSVVVSQDCAGVEADEIALAVHGSAGALRWSLHSSGERLCVCGEDGSGSQSTRYAETFESGTRRAFAALFEGLYARIRARRGLTSERALAQDAPTLAEGRDGVALLDAAVRSAAEGRWVDVARAAA